MRVGMPHSAPPPWVPAFAGMTRWGAGMMRWGGRGDEVEGRNGERGAGMMKGVMRGGGGNGGMGSCLRRPLRSLSVSPSATPITLTSILSQDGRGGGTPPSQSSPIKGEEVKKGDGDRPGPARFFVAGPPQNDMLGGWVGLEDYGGFYFDEEVGAG